MQTVTAPTALGLRLCREIPIAGGWDTPESRSVSSVKALYVADRITADELEHRLEPILLREAPIGHPVPDGWEPVPPCEHFWVDITALGQAQPHELCGRCGDERIR